MQPVLNNEIHLPIRSISDKCIKFNTISYERSKGDSYNRQSLRLEATVEENEDEQSVLDWLKSKVDYELGFTNDDLKLKNQKLLDAKRSIEQEIKDLEHQLHQAKQRWEKVKAFLEKLGVPLPLEDDIPF